MILGLAKRDNSLPLKTKKEGDGLFVVLNAYEGQYEYFQDEKGACSEVEMKEMDPIEPERLP